MSCSAYVSELAVEGLTEIGALNAVEVVLELRLAQEKIYSENKRENVVCGRADDSSEEADCRADEAEYAVFEEVGKLFCEGSPVELLEVELVEEIACLLLQFWVLAELFENEHLRVVEERRELQTYELYGVDYLRDYDIQHQCADRSNAEKRKHKRDRTA